MRSAHTDDFTCVICQHRIWMRWNVVGPGEQIPPVCRSCESHYAKGAGQTMAGSFRDRREAIRLFAVAEALHCAAKQIQWSIDYGAA